MATRTEFQAINETLFDQLSTPGMEKQAADAVTEFTRVAMREDGFYRRIMAPIQVTNSDLDRQVDTDLPVIVVDKEPGSPAAVSIPFATLPTSWYILGPRYRVTFGRIVTPRFTKDVDALRSWIMDIRQVLSDNAVKDALAEEDSAFVSSVNDSLVGQDSVVPQSGVVQWKSIAGGITRDSLYESMKIMPRTPSHLEVHTCLVNNVTINDVCKFHRGEMGGNLSEDIMKNGWTLESFMGRRWIVTIKRSLVPDNTIFMFSDPKFIGKNFLLEDATMWIKREAFMLEFFLYMTEGGSIGNTSGLARADFLGGA